MHSPCRVDKKHIWIVWGSDEEKYTFGDADAEKQARLVFQTSQARPIFPKKAARLISEPVKPVFTGQFGSSCV